MKKSDKRNKQEQKKFNRKMQMKLAVLFIVIMLALIGLSVRLTYINAESGDKYTKQVLSQQQYDSQSIPFRRGDITDVKGTILATSEKVYNVILDCKVVNSDEKYIQPTISALTSCFELNESDLQGILNEKKDSRYVILLKKLSYEEIQTFIQMQDEIDEKTKEKKNPYIKGVWFEDEYLRTYPYGSLASSLLGFTVSGNVGNWGIEQYYNDQLNGVDGREYGYLNDDSELERTIKAATDGNTVVTTIDATVQGIVEKHIAAFNEEYRGSYREDDDGSKNTSVIIANPNDGSIIAMASSSNHFDLNNPRDLSVYYSEEDIAAMDDETKLNNLNQIWKNSCITDTYEPGSTAKPFTVASAIDSGKITGNETYTCNGFLNVGGWDIGCNATHGTVTVEQALMKSCNVALMHIALTEGKEVFTKYQSIFNIGKKTGIDLPGEASGIIYSLENMGQTDLATNAFGQNFNVTMIQMVSAFSSIINGGYYYKPHVASKILDSKGATVSTVEPVLLKQTISKSTSDKLKQYLYKTVCDQAGTGKTARVEGYEMGGKTGTAEKQNRDKINYVVSFLGYVPQDDPQVVIYVVIDEPNVEKQSNSIYAQKVAKGILEEILPYLNIFPTQAVEKTEQSTQTTQEASQTSESTTQEQSEQEQTTQENIEESSTSENAALPYQLGDLNEDDSDNEQN
ncbi:stage V sporulation protein D (sporulation-specific penicillin-binding protein) [Lachnotalea glycerini]|uniref:Stage V sporulation protein D (Sporulation-specific penicillin-binding protein) n=1 Tax=Lachnotalea glycerini TaxID=1763509 RepID=A0A318ELH4_9FIRM|nr:penicillin-binding protein 2 [Lachnotalea glycerini]PXV89518.1 stage V sporulation protein D (sporulation-specific penicillin-binding protein) [Lachnotalea glycerini]